MSRKLSRYIDAIRQRAIPDFWDASVNAIVPASTLEYTSAGPLAGGASPGSGIYVASTNYGFYVATNDSKTWQVSGISYRFSTQATGAASFILEVAGAAIAPGSGTAQTGNLTLQGTANTTINGTLTAQTIFGAGSQLNILVNSTATTGLVGLMITVSLQRVT